MEKETKERKSRPYLGDAGMLVRERVKRLQTAYLNGKAHARRDLAELRSAVNRDPGAVPAVWSLTNVPLGDPSGSTPTPTEWAVHLTMTLYGTHQQGRSVPVYDPQIPFSSAVRRLASEVGEDATVEKSPVWRRFTAAMLAGDIEGTREHLQSLIGQMHSSKRLLAFDYGGLAHDLEQMQFPGGAERVRLKWQRDFYRTVSDDSQEISTQKAKGEQS